MLYTRPEGQADESWRVVDMKKPDDSPESRRVARLEKVDTPMAYRVVAGSALAAASTRARRCISSTRN